jgi:hypothetical protein
MNDERQPHSTFWRVVNAQPGLGLALLIYLGLALSYFFIVPIFEAPDEWTHTGHVKYIAEGNGLPVMLPGRGIWGGQQPPLYYIIGAALVQPFELAAFDRYAERTRNPHASLGYALDPGNKNNYLHDPTENFPYRGLALTVHVLRLYSMVYGLLTLVFIYLTASELMSSVKCQVSSAGRQAQDRTYYTPRITRYVLRFMFYAPSLFATTVALFVACQPMFAFITASVANEPANMAFCAIGLWLAQRYVLYGPTHQWWRAVTLGVVLGLISISKMTGLSFGLVVVVALLITSVTTRKRPGAARLLWRDGFIIGFLFLLIGGWWYWRNYQLYGDFFQQGLYKIYFNVDPQPLTLSDFLYTLSTGEVSFWATFGWLNIVAPDWLYSFYRIISRIGLIGLALGLIAQVTQAPAADLSLHSRPSTSFSGRPESSSTTYHPLPITHYVLRFTFYPPLLLHLTFPLALAFSLTRLVAIEGGLQGRQLLPALGSIAIVIIWGWWVLCPVRLRLPILGTLLFLMFGLALWLPYGLVAPEYIPSPLLTEAAIPPRVNRLNLTFNDEIKLIGAELGLDKVRPGERVPVTVYWQALKPMNANYSVFVHLIGREYQNVGQFNSYPALGLRPTTTLQPGQIWRDTYPTLVNGGSQAPTRLLVNVGLFNIREPGRPGFPAIGPDGREVSPAVGQLKLVPVAWSPPPTTPPLAEFGDNIELNSFRLENCARRETPCLLTLTWLAQGVPSADYTVFIQLWQADRQVKGFDNPPLGNDYPTHLWEAGEVIEDPHPLDLASVAPGEYKLLVGLYNLTSGDRLPASAQGKLLPGNAVDLGLIQVK